MNKSHRESIFVEQADIIEHTAYAGDQHIMRVHAPDIANHAVAGSFAHISCDPMLAMRRPISIMRVNPRAGWVDFLYKAIGRGTKLLASRQVGEQISVIGPIGTPFKIDPDRPRALLIGGGVGMPPMIFLAETLKALKNNTSLAIFGSEVPFPFTSRPSTIMIPGMPEGVIATMPLLEDWGIPCRLASLQGYVGCFEGYVTDLARHWLDALSETQRKEVIIYSCGPHPMLKAVAKLAADYQLPCQVSLEEHMACGVGGCAGCAVEVKTDQGPAMKRVCVDGPVFNAEQVF